jgi:2-aminoadipate transaminase
MKQIFSDRISDVPRSFIREILKVAVDESVLSFAGGLPNRELFPKKALQEATNLVFENRGSGALQYSNSEGLLELRQWISDRYRRRMGLEIPVETILITSGSQQGLDLLAKIFLNDGDEVLLEEPGYLGAIQAFSVYRPKFLTVPVSYEGVDIDALKQTLVNSNPKLMYGVPNFQNPSGISYTEENRRAVAEELKGKPIYFIEDDPYGELRYSGIAKSSFADLIPDQTLLLGSFSKTIVPSFRLGWMVAPTAIMEKVLIAKQATDLHTNFFSQCVVSEYLKMGKFEQQIGVLCQAYGRQRDAMVAAIRKYFPEGVHFSEPEGGMFLWVTLPNGGSAMKLFERAIANKVAFVPGYPFYIGKTDTNTLRLNFSNVSIEEIDTGMARLGAALKDLDLGR